MHVKLPNKSEQKAIWIEKKWFILVHYRRYNSTTLSPLPRWKVDQNIGILFLMSLTQKNHRLTRNPCTKLFLWYKNMITRKWVKRFVNERMFSTVWHLGLLCFGFYVFGSVSTQVTMYYHCLFGIGTCTVGRIINSYWVLQIIHFVISCPLSGIGGI